MHHPGDIRLLTAVRNDKLSAFVSASSGGAIFFSTQGTRSRADEMGGGDYDGDTFIIIYRKDEFVYNVDNQLIKYSRNSVRNGRESNIQIIQYTWKQGNVTNKTDRSLLGGYEEEDYQYGTSENQLAKFYKEELNLFGGFTPELISQNSPSTNIKLFEGSSYKYESEVNQSNKLTGYKILINKGGTWQDYSQIKIS